MSQPRVIRWPGGEHAFKLGIGDARVIQQKTDCGPEYLLARLSAGQWLVDDMPEILRNGLIGAGMTHVEALKLVQRAFEHYPPVAFKPAALEVMGAYLYGDPDDPVGEPLPVNPTPAASDDQTGSGSSAPTTG